MLGWPVWRLTWSRASVYSLGAGSCYRSLTAIQELRLGTNFEVEPFCGNIGCLKGVRIAVKQLLTFGEKKVREKRSPFRYRRGFNLDPFREQAESRTSFLYHMARDSFIGQNDPGSLPVGLVELKGLIVDWWEHTSKFSEITRAWGLRGRCWRQRGTGRCTRIDRKRKHSSGGCQTRTDWFSGDADDEKLFLCYDIPITHIPLYPTVGLNLRYRQIKAVLMAPCCGFPLRGKLSLSRTKVFVSQRCHLTPLHPGPIWIKSGVVCVIALCNATSTDINNVAVTGVTDVPSASKCQSDSRHYRPR
jgi:hypothetical protein